ncbi:glycosyltransferase family 2 protein [Guyparkeria halophila]|uniref:Glycosyltransferase family 2 protein n=1 Tax=Guyparkeria halophila TaxID=47960 RepID=A0ABZ0YW65_9GAMM|nr:glycosyltransferase family 2 protein [Guyparkeria halophila]WQH16268.1 glycosyltransferase family 2 protein [Guyparkeria halophila]
MRKDSPALSVVLPAKNEAGAVGATVEGIRSRLADAEVLVIDDGSEDDTASMAKAFGAAVISHPYSMGNGAAIKTGARHATGEVIVFMDADGQHDPADIPRLLERLGRGFDMVVGARSNDSQASVGRGLANRFYNRLASWMVGQRVQDLTSGFRAVKADKFREFLHLLPNGFSYPTTTTMAFFRAGYPVAYEPIVAGKRIGKSHIRLVRDGIRFLLIIFKIGTLYSPLKLFLPIAFAHFLLGLGYYGYTFTVDHRLSSITVFLWSASVTIFLIGLVSEQITQLMYKRER